MVTLFGGRTHLLEAYLHHLWSIDYPRDKIHLVWYTNSKNEIFREILKSKGEGRTGNYKSVNVIFDDDVPESMMLFEEADFQYSMMHGEIIARLYNSVWEKLPDVDFVFSLEDDMLASSHCVKRLLEGFKEGKDVAHHGNVFVVDFERLQGDAEALFRGAG